MFTQLPQMLKACTQRRTIVMFLLGFASGLPLLLTGSALQAWFTEAGISIVTIGMLGLVGTPYTLKFLWSPFLDRYVMPFLGRRQGWILVMQLAVIVFILAMSVSSPVAQPKVMACLAVLLAFFSATQDIAINAYQAEVFPPEERGLGAAMYTGGYRMAMLVAGGFALILADHMGWRATYQLMAAFMGICLLATWIAPNPQNTAQPPKHLVEAVYLPFKEFISRKGAILMLLFLVLYKIGDAFTLSLSTTFLLRGLHFTLTEVGSITKVVGMVATLVGALVGGLLMIRLRLFRSLWWFGILQTVSNLSYWLLAVVGKQYGVMVFAVFFEHFAGGMATAAFVALVMALCDHRYTATQFALLTAFASFGRVFVGPAAGVMVEAMGWVHFYMWCFVAGFPGMILLWYLRHHKVFDETSTDDSDSALEQDYAPGIQRTM